MAQALPGVRSDRERREDDRRSCRSNLERRVGLVKGKSPDVVHDYGGPDGRLRIWVKTGDTLKYRLTYMKEEEIKCLGDSIKKGTDEDVHRRASLMASGRTKALVLPNPCRCR